MPKYYRNKNRWFEYLTWHEISFLWTRFKAWRNGEAVGISRRHHAKFYDYRYRKKKRE